MKVFEHPDITASRRENWHDLILHPHRVKGRLPDTASAGDLELVRLDPAPGRVVWMFAADHEGRFEVSNVAHGDAIKLITKGGSESLQSSPFQVAPGDDSVHVVWPGNGEKGQNRKHLPPA